MRIKEMIWIWIFILLAGAVMAVPPVQTTITNEGIRIEYPKQPIFLLNNPDKLHIHVMNSTGYLLTNATTTCLLHIYNDTGNHVVEANMTYDSNLIDFFYNLPETITSQAEVYSYIINCYNGKEAGYVSTTFEISQSAPADNLVGGFPLAALIIVPMLFGIMLLIGSFMFGEDHAVLKIALFLIAYLTVFLSLWFGVQTIVRYYGFADLQEAIGTTVWIIGIIFFVILSYFLIYAFIQGIEASAQKKRKEMEY